MSNNQQKTINILLSVIIVLLICIAIGAFFYGKNVGGNKQGSTSVVNNGEPITVELISDTRCTDCFEDDIVKSLKSIPALSNANFVKKDFNDAGIKDYLKKNNLNVLPVILFDRAYVDQGINQYLTATPDGKYSLNIGAQFDPFLERSEKGFTIISKENITKVKEGTHIKGSADAKITWLEYSDLECPYCARLHNSSTATDLEKKYGTKLNKIFSHYPLNFHANAQKAAEALECVAESTGIDAYYKLITASYKKYNNNNFDTEGFYDLAETLGVNKSKLIECVNSGKYSEKVKNQMQLGQTLFNITGTPGNVFINNETGEYAILSGAHSTQTFEKIIDKLLK